MDLGGVGDVRRRTDKFIAQKGAAATALSALSAAAGTGAPECHQGSDFGKALRQTAATFL